MQTNSLMPVPPTAIVSLSKALKWIFQQGTKLNIAIAWKLSCSNALVHSTTLHSPVSSLVTPPALCSTSQQLQHPWATPILIWQWLWILSFCSFLLWARQQTDWHRMALFLLHWSESRVDNPSAKGREHLSFWDAADLERKTNKIRKQQEGPSTITKRTHVPLITKLGSKEFSSLWTGFYFCGSPQE